MDLLTFSYATLVFANCFFFFPPCLLIFLLLSSWSVVCLALCHWVVPNLLPGQALVACAEEGGGGTKGGGGDTWSVVYRFWKARVWCYFYFNRLNQDGSSFLFFVINFTVNSADVLFCCNVI